MSGIFQRKAAKDPSKKRAAPEVAPMAGSEAAEDARSRILDATHQLVGDHGFEGTSIRDIARVSGTNPALAYYYFGSKEGLFEALANRNADIATSVLGEALRMEGSTRDRVRHFLKGWMRVLYGPARPLAPWFRKAVQGRSSLGDHLRSRVAGNISLLAGILDEGVRRGEIRKPSMSTQTLATGLMVSVAGLAMEVVLPHRMAGLSLETPKERDEFVEGMLDAWFSGIETRKNPGS